MSNITYESPVLNRLMKLFEKDRSFIKEIVDMFLDQAPKAIHDLGNGLQSQNANKTEKAIQELESICADFESSKLKETLHEIHDELEAGHFEMACTSFQSLKLEFNQIKKEIIK